MRAALILASLVLTLQSGLLAQQRPAIDSGKFIRVSYDCHDRTLSSGAVRRQCQRQEGTLVRLAGDTLTLAVVRPGTDTVVQSSTLNYPLSTLMHLEVSRGQVSRVGQGVGIGLLIGVPAGVLLGMAISRPAGACEDCDLERSISEVVGALFMGVAGAFIGGSMGAARSGERWEEVPSSQWRVSLAPQRDRRLGLGVSIKF